MKISQKALTGSLIASTIFGASNAFIPLGSKQTSKRAVNRNTRSKFVAFATVPEKGLGSSDKTGQSQPETASKSSELQQTPRKKTLIELDLEEEAEQRVEKAMEIAAEAAVEKAAEATINERYAAAAAAAQIAKDQVQVQVQPVVSDLPPSTIEKDDDIIAVSSPKAEISSEPPTVPRAKKKMMLTDEQLRAAERIAEMNVEKAMEMKVERAAELAVEKIMEQRVENDMKIAAQEKIESIASSMYSEITSTPNDSSSDEGETKAYHLFESEADIESSLESPSSILESEPDLEQIIIEPKLDTTIVEPDIVSPLKLDSVAVDSQIPSVSASLSTPVADIAQAQVEFKTPKVKEVAAIDLLQQQNVSIKLEEMAEVTTENLVEVIAEDSAEYAAELAVDQLQLDAVKVDVDKDSGTSVVEMSIQSTPIQIITETAADDIRSEVKIADDKVNVMDDLTEVELAARKARDLELEKQVEAAMPALVEEDAAKIVETKVAPSQSKSSASIGAADMDLDIVPTSDAETVSVDIPVEAAPVLDATMDELEMEIENIAAEIEALKNEITSETKQASEIDDVGDMVNPQILEASTQIEVEDSEKLTHASRKAFIFQQKLLETRLSYEIKAAGREKLDIASRKAFIFQQKLLETRLSYAPIARIRKAESDAKKAAEEAKIRVMVAESNQRALLSARLKMDATVIRKQREIVAETKQRALLMTRLAYEAEAVTRRAIEEAKCIKELEAKAKGFMDKEKKRKKKIEKAAAAIEAEKKNAALVEAGQRALLLARLAQEADKAAGEAKTFISNVASDAAKIGHKQRRANKILKNKKLKGKAADLVSLELDEMKLTDEEATLAAKRAAEILAVKDEEEEHTGEEADKPLKAEKVEAKEGKSSKVTKQSEESNDKIVKDYSTMDSADRAYHILLDLGMIFEHPDPDDPSYDHSLDDELVPVGVWV